MYKNEERLIKGLILSKDEAFDELLDLYGDDILRFCYMKISDISVAEDLTQETFIKVYKKIGSFKKKSSLKTWIYKIALNSCREYFRKNKKEVEVRSDNCKIPEIIDTFDLEEEIINSVSSEYIVNSLEKLRPIYRDIIYMFYYKEFSVKDIASVLGENENTVKTRLSRGRRELKSILVESEIYG